MMIVQESKILIMGSYVKPCIPPRVTSAQEHCASLGSAAIESHHHEGGKMTVAELSSRLSLNHGIISPLRLTTHEKEHKTGRTKIAGAIVPEENCDGCRCDSQTSSRCILSSG